SNHVMGGYKDQPWTPGELTPELPPRPGTRYQVGGELRNSDAYAATKLFGERLGCAFAQAYKMTVIAVRLGWSPPGENRPGDLPPGRERWFRLMWLSNRDLCRLMLCCLEADLPAGLVIVNGMSNNHGMPWDLERTRRAICYVPLDGLDIRS